MIRCVGLSTGAQRLSASKELSRSAEQVRKFLAGVLNAFRHQRNSHHRPHRRAGRADTCSTPFGIKGTLTTSLPQGRASGKPVLNAFRHQRNSHSRERRCGGYDGCAQRLSASKELSRLMNLDYWPLLRVLNAFRHQRNSHSGHGTGRTHPGGCSTPFGIKGTLTIDFLDRPIAFHRCSTPFGIKGTLTFCRNDDSSRHLRCSTPFGIKGTLTGRLR